MTKYLIYLAVGVAVIALIGSAYFSWKHKIYLHGWNDAIASIAAQNDEAAQAAAKVQTNVDLCYEFDREWDVTTGTCLPAKP